MKWISLTVLLFVLAGCPEIQIKKSQKPPSNFAERYRRDPEACIRHITMFVEQRNKELYLRQFKFDPNRGMDAKSKSTYNALPE